MLKADFQDAEAKLQRANEHIADLQGIIAELLNPKFYRLFLDTEKETGRMMFGYESLHQPSKRFNLVLGDAVSTLRTVLDYAMNAALFPITGVYAEGFPFRDHRNDLEQSIKKGPIAKLGTKLVAALLDDIQAQKGGTNEALWILNKLRNIDKHRLLIATTEMAAVSVSLIAGNVPFRNTTFAAPPGRRNVILDIPATDIKFTSEPRAVFEVRFNEPPYIEGKDVGGFLRQASSQVAGVLKAFKILLN